jgi:hypothetical protein
VTRAAAADPDADDAPRPRFMPMGNWLPAEQVAARHQRPAADGGAVTGGSPFAGALSQMMGDLLLAGCKEGPNNFSYDARIAAAPVAPSPITR